MTLERFESKVDRNAANGCAEFTGHLQNRGYGLFWFEGRKMLAHRFAWEREHGPITEGLEVDHLCRNRRCVNTEHMELVTHRENLLRSPDTVFYRTGRKTHCVHGHEFTIENTCRLRRPGGRIERACRACARRRSNAYRITP